MNSDIRIQSGWYRHPKIVKLRRRMGAEGVLGLVTLWTWTGEQRPNGRLTGMDAEDIAIAAGYPEDPQGFVDTLIALNLLDEDEDGGMSIHDWEENNPYAAGAEWRHERAKKANAARREKEENRYKPATSTLEARYERTTSAAPSPSPSPSPAPIAFFSPLPPATPEPTPAPTETIEPEPPKKEKKVGGFDSDPRNQPIPAGWQPQPATLDITAGLGIPDHFAADQVSLFALHHREAGTRRGGFESLFVGWCKRAWSLKAEERSPGERRKGETILEHSQRLRRMYLESESSERALEGEVIRAH